MTHAKKKKFNKSQFIRFGTTKTKADADKAAAYIKNKGFCYRIEKTSSGYTLWWKKK